MSESVVNISTPQRDVRVAAVLQEIEAYRQLKDDWDLAGALAVEAKAADAASRLIVLASLKAAERGLAWQDPIVGPVADGGIALSWVGASRRALLIVHPGQADAVECVTRAAGCETSRRVTTLADAVTCSLWALASVR
jgi:hypothetical protein